MIRPVSAHPRRLALGLAACLFNIPAWLTAADTPPQGRALERAPREEVVAPATADPESITLPEMGASSGNVMTPAEEQRLGHAFMRSVRNSVRVMDDPLLNEYLTDLGTHLAEQSRDRHKHFAFFLVDDPVINAFAGPSGYIGVHAGLIVETQSESELASVVAHEISHVTQNHLFRAFDEFSRLTGPVALATLGAILLSAVSGQAAMAAIAGIQAGMMQAQLNFTRANEEEADREGIKILADAGYDPRAMPMFFERLTKATRLYESKDPLPEFLRTHPVTTNRIADALGRAESYPYRQPREDPRYHLLRATIRMQGFKDSKAAVEHFRSTLKEGRYRHAEAERYGYVLALIRDHQFDTARAELNPLLKRDPGNPAYLIASAHIDHAAGQPQMALRTLRTALDLYPSNYPLSITYAELLLETGDGKQARQILTLVQHARGDDPEVYALLGRAAEAEGHRAEAHGFMAEHYYATGQLEAAVQQLEIALRDKSLSYYDSARLTARLSAMQTELRGHKDERRQEDRERRR
jgi:beta-barrel assembly-enhancing protease